MDFGIGLHSDFNYLELLHANGDKPSQMPQWPPPVCCLMFYSHQTFNSHMLTGPLIDGRHVSVFSAQVYWDHYRCHEGVQATPAFKQVSRCDTFGCFDSVDIWCVQYLLWTFYSNLLSGQFLPTYSFAPELYSFMKHQRKRISNHRSSYKLNKLHITGT